MQPNLDENAKCEACKRRDQVEVIDEDDATEPYLLCSACAQRLRLRALRPSEWFNLASKHGWQKYSLHDDFYDDDGTALQPDVVGFSTGGMLAPSLTEVSQNPERLFGYCITRQRLGHAEFAALRSFPAEKLLAVLKHCAANGNTHIFVVGLAICANVLGPLSAAWVRDQYERSRTQDALYPWAEAAARCLPMQEGLAKTIDALEGYTGRDLRDRIGALTCFRSPLVLEWIESNAPKTNVTQDWGRLAALSNLTWAKVDAWLAHGRPLSLIALDALNQFIPSATQPPLVRNLQPILLGNPDPTMIVQALQRQMQTDPAPRSIQLCEDLIKHIDALRIADAC